MWEFLKILFVCFIAAGGFIFAFWYFSRWHDDSVQSSLLDQAYVADVAIAEEQAYRGQFPPV